MAKPAHERRRTLPPRFGKHSSSHGRSLFFVTPVVVVVCVCVWGGGCLAAGASLQLPHEILIHEAQIGVWHTACSAFQLFMSCTSAVHCFQKQKEEEPPPS